MILYAYNKGANSCFINTRKFYLRFFKINTRSLLKSFSNKHPHKTLKIEQSLGFLLEKIWYISNATLHYAQCLRIWIFLGLNEEK